MLIWAGRIKSTLVALLTLSLLVFALSGCVGQKLQAEGDGNQHAQTPQENLNIAVYYVKYTPETAYLVREVHTIPPTDKPLKAAVEELIRVKPQTEGAVNIIPPDTRVLDVKVENATACVNFSREVLQANIGSQGEGLGIQSIVNTLTEFPEVKSVEFKVEGKLDDRARDWWGHVGLYEQPFKRNLAKVFEPPMWITHPQRNQVVGVPMLIKGSARVWEGKISAKLLDSNANVLAEKHTVATASAPERGEFELSIKYTPPDEESGKLVIYGLDPNKGHELITVTTPVKWP